MHNNFKQPKVQNLSSFSNPSYKLIFSTPGYSQEVEMEIIMNGKQERKLCFVYLYLIGKKPYIYDIHIKMCVMHL